jgi:hypothetical protein
MQAPHTYALPLIRPFGPLFPVNSEKEPASLADG